MPLVIILINHIDYKGLNWPTGTRVSELANSHSLTPNHLGAMKAFYRFVSLTPTPQPF